MWTGDLQLMTPGYRKERRGVERTNQIENSGRSEDGREGEGGGALFKYLITSRRRMMNYLNTPPRPRGPESKNMFCCKKRHELKHTSVSTSFNTHTHTLFLQASADHLYICQRTQYSGRINVLTLVSLVSLKSSNLFEFLPVVYSVMCTLNTNTSFIHIFFRRVRLIFLCRRVPSDKNCQVDAFAPDSHRPTAAGSRFILPPSRGQKSVKST